MGAGKRAAGQLSEEGPSEVPEDGNDTGWGTAAHGQDCQADGGGFWGLELEYLPPGCPDLNAMEEKWRQMKHRTLDVPYVAMGNLRKEITHYLRYHMPVLQIENYLYRKL